MTEVVKALFDQLSNAITRSSSFCRNIYFGWTMPIKIYYAGSVFDILFLLTKISHLA